MAGQIQFLHDCFCACAKCDAERAAMNKPGTVRYMQRGCDTIVQVMDDNGVWQDRTPWRPRPTPQAEG